jgi:hypothetical protein
LNEALIATESVHASISATTTSNRTVLILTLTFTTTAYSRPARHAPEAADGVGDRGGVLVPP